MEGKNVQLAAFAFMLMIAVAMGQQNCPPVTSFQDCLDFVHKDNKMPTYDSPCCNLIRSTSESCLCKTASSNFPGLDLEKALTLPKNCGRKVPDNTYCGSHKVPQ